MKKTLSELIADHKGPPVNVEAIVHGVGLELDKKAELDSEIAGQIELTDSGKYKISANNEDHYFRQRFTIAHELGHFLYHRELISDGIDDDRAYRSVNVGRFHNKNVNSTHETEVNKFQVSPSAMRTRLDGLGLLDLG